MLTKFQASMHAKRCGLQGHALPIPIRTPWAYFTVACDIVHPETMEPLVCAGDTLSGVDINRLSTLYGVDYITVQ